MRDQKSLREITMRESRQALGTSPYSPRLTVAGATGSFMLPELLALPVDITTQHDLQETDGDMVFMVDFSAFDGTDPWA